jgi:hypothetical protein
MAGSRCWPNARLGYSRYNASKEIILLAVLLSETDGVFIQHSELPIPALAFGAIAMSVFILLAFVVYSYRDVANRHDHKNSSSQGH